MAQYRGTVRGGRGEGSRLGHKTTGLTTIAKGWGGNIEVELWWNAAANEDWCRIWHHWDGGTHKLYSGPLSQHVDPRGRQLPIKEEG